MATVIIPAVSKTHDALGNNLEHAGQVRHLARVIDVNVGVTTTLDYVDFGDKVDLEINNPIISGWLIPNGANFNGALSWQSEEASGNVVAGIWLRYQLADTSWRLAFSASSGNTTVAVVDADVNQGESVYFVIYRESNSDTFKLWRSLNGVEKTLSFGVSNGDINYISTQKRTLLGGLWRADAITQAGTAKLGTCIAAPYSVEALELIKKQHIPDTAIWAVSFNEGQGDTVYDLIGDNNGTWTNHTDPNQWGKSDDAIDYELIDTKLRAGTDSKIDFNPYLALGEGVPRDYEAEGLVPADAYMYMNQTFVPSPTFGVEADAAITNMEIKTPYERQFVAEFVETLLDIGAYNLIDEQMLLGLRHGAGLKMMKGSVVPVNNGAVYVEGVGYSFDGISNYFNLNFNPSLHSVNYSLDDGQVGAFVQAANNLGSNLTILGVVQTDVLQIIINTTPNYTLGINEASQPSFAVGANTPNNSLLMLTRTAPNTTNLYRNSILINIGSTISTALPNNSIFLGGRNNNGNPQLYLNGTISSFIIGAAIGFPQLDYYNALTTVQTKIEYGNKISDILIYNSELKSSDDVRRLYSFINEPLGKMEGLIDYEAVALDRLIRNERSV